MSPMVVPAPPGSRPSASAASGAPAAEERALRRAARSLRCLPFRRAFYGEVDGQAMAASELCARADWARLVFAPFGVERAEAHFRWLIRLGVLRREVDGQGLTERVRLTPMGRSLLSSWSGEVPRAGLRERIQENFHRHRPRF